MKKKYAFWLSQETKEELTALYTEDCCTSQSEFVEKAVKFYCGYVKTKGDHSYLPRILSDELEGTVGVMANRIGRLLFKQSVELGILSHIIAADTDVDQVTLRKLRGRCVDDVRHTNGQIEFKDILQFQKEV